jgi:hypothetical protein
MLYETACSSPVFGSRLGCAVYPPVSVWSKVAYADGVQLVVELVVREPRLDQRKGFAGVSYHVGVGTDRRHAEMPDR